MAVSFFSKMKKNRIGGGGLFRAQRKLELELLKSSLPLAITSFSKFMIWLEDNMLQHGGKKLLEITKMWHH